MRILVHVTGTTMLRHFSDVIQSLAQRGHTVRIASPDLGRDLPLPAALSGRERISFVTCPQTRADEWGHHVYTLRAMRDYLRYLDEPFSEAPKLRGRALSKLVKVLIPAGGAELGGDELARLFMGSGAAVRSRLDAVLALTESTIRSDPTIEGFLRAERPDVVVVTPLVKIGSHQADYVKSARALGVPVAFPVFSWDNLSTKGLIHVLPDRVLVWNHWQRAEAIELHRVPPERIVVTGAPRFDEFFRMKPRMSRERFVRRLRLDASQPIVTYLCSSRFVARHEREFVVRWISEVRRTPGLQACNIVIRPHPRGKEQWKVKLRIPGVKVAYPRSISVDQTLYDTVYHSAAVVGLNTSAQLEAGIVGRPVLTVLAPEFAGGQQGTVHFHYLLKEHGGFVELAGDFETHRRQLSAAVAGHYDPQAIRTFIQRFLRPCGLERRVTPLMVQAIEELARTRRGWRAALRARAWHGVRSPLAWLRRCATMAVI